MRENIRLKQQPFQLSVGVKQACAVLVAALLIMGAAFALGLGLGRRSGGAQDQPSAAPRDALARLDDPLPAKDEPPPELKAHQALTDTGSIDKTMPVPAVSATKAAAPPVHAEERTAPEHELVTPPAIAAPPPIAPPAQPAVPPLPAAAPPAPGAPADAAVAAPAPRPAHPAARASRPAASESPRSALRAKPKQKARGAYTIQIASTQHRADAERAAKRLAARKPRIVAADVPGKGRWYRVQVGAYETRESARVALLSMSGVHGIVTPAR